MITFFIFKVILFIAWLAFLFLSPFSAKGMSTYSLFSHIIFYSQFLSEFIYYFFPFPDDGNSYGIQMFSLMITFYYTCFCSFFSLQIFFQFLLLTLLIILWIIVIFVNPSNQHNLSTYLFLCYFLIAYGFFP